MILSFPEEKTWFTSDTHFGHQKAIDRDMRPFKNTDEMDNEIIKNWNELVYPDDYVIHLGDFGNFDILDKLHGKIYLLPGNWDIGWPKPEQLAGTLASGQTIKVGPEYFAVTHKPLNLDDRDKFYLFGHIHGSQKVKRNGINVGQDCHYFRPINMDTIRYLKDGIEKYFDDNVWCESKNLKK